MTAHGQKGFTLVELMVVIFIIGLLASLVLVNVAGDAGQARRLKAQADVAALETGLERYRLHMRRYPRTDEGLEILVRPPDGQANALYPPGGFIRRLPLDPWGNAYGYRSPGEDGRLLDIFSYGADGRPGGQGADADIGNW